MNDAINPVTLCQELVRIQSVNPGGCEDQCAQFLGDLLLGGGFEVTYHDFAPGRVSGRVRRERPGVQFVQPRLNFFGEHRWIRHFLSMGQATAPTHHQKVPESAGEIIDFRDLIVDLIRRTGSRSSRCHLRRRDGADRSAYRRIGFRRRPCGRLARYSPSWTLPFPPNRCARSSGNGHR